MIWILKYIKDTNYRLGLKFCKIGIQLSGKIVEVILNCMLQQLSFKYNLSTPVLVLVISIAVYYLSPSSSVLQALEKSRDQRVMSS